MKEDIKLIVRNNNVNFIRYRKGILYYGVVYNAYAPLGEEYVYEFPVPIEDCGDADFPATDKAIMFMRYIRKALDDGTFVRRIV